MWYVIMFVLTLLDIKIENRKNMMFNVWLADDNLYGKWLFT